MMVNLSELAVLKGITINRVLRILAFIGVVADVEFKLFNTKTPLIEESKIEGVDFINTVILKSEKVRLDVLMDIYKVKTFHYSMELVMICIVVVIVLLNMLIFYYLTLLNLKLIFMLKTV